MPFRITIDLLDASYQASTLDRARAEWPPHPSRVFCALVSVADFTDPVHEAALTWLEQQPLPSLRIPAHTLEATPRSAWVPTNATAGKPTHGTLPGRTNGRAPKTWPQRQLEHPLVEVEWPTQPPSGVLLALQALAQAVPYLGRASGHALVHAEAVDEPLAEDGDGRFEVWRPLTDATTRDGRSLRAPYPGYLQRLRTAFDDGQPAWQQDRTFPYTRATATAAAVDEEPTAGPYEDLLTFAFPSGVSLDPALTMPVTGAMRRAVMQRLSDIGHDVEAMAAVHGHKKRGDQRGLCAYLGLPFVGHPHADGRLRGLAIALPRDLDPAHRRALLAVLLRVDGGLRRLNVSGLDRPLSLSYVQAGDPPLDSLRSVRPERWTTPARRWTTALPMVMDRFTNRNEAIEDEVARSCRVAGLPALAKVEVLRQGAYLAGAACNLPAGALRRKEGERPLPARHVRLTFERPLTGPLVLGSKKTFGLGLCVPLEESTSA
ncbi:type I-U CRISPR-associated protein Csb2 [Streptomyces sp. NPDC020667]|uniref:type I-G CRISPR-associated protein Csb2 n=1 Tax=Streptomyces sp. NPDC020667 TaxID=3154895 RepID=UPI0033DC0015